MLLSPGLIGITGLLVLLTYLYGLGGLGLGLLLVSLSSWVTVVWRNNLQKNNSLRATPISNSELTPVTIQDDFKEFVDRMPVPAFIKDAESCTVYVNPYYEALFGAGWVGKSVWDYFPKSVAQRMVDDDREALKQGINQVTEAVPVPDGSGRMFQTMKFPLYREGYPLLLAGFGIDVTERKLAEATVDRINAQLMIANTELEYRHRNMQLLLELSNALPRCSTVPEVSTIISQFTQQLFPQYAGLVALAHPDYEDFQVVTTWGLPSDGSNLQTVPCKHCAAQMIDHSVDKLELGEKICSDWHGNMPIHYICLPIRSLSSTHIQKGEHIRGVLHLYQPNGKPISEIAIQLAQATTTSINLTLTNVELRQALHERSIRDPLTQLFNRRYLKETLPRELARSIREHTPISLLVIDVDYFKKLNDTYGHAAGDKVLQELGRLLRSQVRQGDIACRYGGEEFVLVLPTAAPEDAYHRANEIRRAFEQLQVPYEQQILQATLSIGIAAYPVHGSTDDSLFQAADTALYRAKSEGRNRAIVSDVQLACVLSSV